MIRRGPLALLALLALLAPLAACGSDDDASPDDGSAATSTSPVSEEARAEVLTTYAEGVHASYRASLASATAMDEAIGAFLADPTDASLEAARQAWLTARDDYGVTEAYRFYGGPIDDEETGPEGQINAWPMDEAYVDHVEGDPEAGIVNDPEGVPEITAEALVELNEEGGEANISTGWHAIEFLLWGQDLSEDGPGERPATDYTTAPSAERRGEYLTVTSELLLEDLGGLVEAWAPDVGDNFRADFLADPPEESLGEMFTGVGELSRGELAGERMSVAFLERSQEDEHSCFSDNTTNDIIANATGIVEVVTGTYAAGVEGPGLADLVEEVDPELADQLRSEVEASVADAEAIPVPFDASLQEDIPDDSEGRQAIEATMTSLEGQTDTIVAAAEAVGLTIDVT